MGLLFQPLTRVAVSPNNFIFRMKSILVFLVTILWIGMIQCQTLEEEDQLIEDRGKIDPNEVLKKLNKKLKQMKFGSRALQKNLNKIKSMAKDLADLEKKVGTIMKNTEDNKNSIKNNEKSIKDNADNIEKLEMNVAELDKTCN